MVGPYRFGYSMIIFFFALTSLQVPLEGVHVSIKNRLGSGKNVGIHCRSKDTDLGPQNIQDGSEYGWDFEPNAWGTTLFYCDMAWVDVEDYPFDAYSFARDRSRCEAQCSWIVSMEGMYGLNGQSGFWEFMYYWPI